MSSVSGFISITILCMPLFFAFVGAVIVVCSSVSESRPPDKRVMNILCGYFLLSLLIWVGVLSMSYFPDSFVRFNYIYFGAALLVPVTLFGFAHTLTRNGRERRLSPVHFFIPVFISLMLVLSLMLVPPETYMAAAYGKAVTEMSGETERGMVIFDIKIVVVMAVNIIYLTMALIRVRRGQRMLEEYSSSGERSSLRWLMKVLVVSLILAPAPALSLIFPFIPLNLWIMPFAVIAAVLYALMAHNTVSRNYVLVDNEEDYDGNPDVGGKEGGPAAIFSNEAGNNGEIAAHHNKDMEVKYRLEEYISDVKPYLDTEFRITDLAEAIGTNRTFLSSFINRIYGVNFNRFMNGYRLGELEELMRNPALASKGRMQLIAQAGFGSYRSYLRAKDICEAENSHNDKESLHPDGKP